MDFTNQVLAFESDEKLFENEKKMKFGMISKKGYNFNTHWLALILTTRKLIFFGARNEGKIYPLI